MTTSDNNKRIAKNTMLLYIRMFFTMGVGFFTSRVILEALGFVDYGIYNVVGGIVAMLSVLNGSMAGATQRWITIALGKDNEHYLKKVFSVGLSAQAIMVVVVFIISESLGLLYLSNYAVIPSERLDVSFWVFQISVLTVLLDIINVPFLGAIMAHERMGAFAFFSVIDVIMKLVICYALYISTHDLLLVYASLVFLTYVLNFVMMQLYCYKNFVEARFKFGWDKIMFKEMSGLAFWSMSGSIAYMGYTQGLTLLINLFFGPTMNAAAAVAGQAGNIVNQFSRNFQTALNPQITKTYAKGNYSEMHQLIFRSSKFSYFLMLFFVIPIFFEAHLLLGIWLKQVPDHTINFLRIGLFVSMFMAVRNPLVTSAQANGNIKKYQFVVISILLTVCPVSYFFLKSGFIPETTAIVMLLTIIVAVFASAYMLKDMIHLNFREFVYQVMYKILLVTLLSFILPLAIFYLMDEGIIRLFVLSAVSTVVCLASIFYVGLTDSERVFIVTIIKTQLMKYNLLGK
jgi:O-antigen/teichoic acid export membrane protein